MNLGNQPVEILIEDVYLLVVPSSENGYDPEEEERRMQAAKAERLENAELLHIRGQAEEADGKLSISEVSVCVTEVLSGDKQQSQGLLSSLITKIVNNLQVTVKNIHIRYEDKLSVPGVSGIHATRYHFCPLIYAVASVLGGCHSGRVHCRFCE